MAQTGLNQPPGGVTLRVLVGKVCRLLVRYGALLTLFETDYPTVVAALRALQAACVATGFDKLPESDLPPVS